MIGFAYPQLFEKNLVQLIIKVLACVDKDMVDMPVQFGDYARKPDDFRPCADDRHDFKRHVYVSVPSTQQFAVVQLDFVAYQQTMALQ